MDTSWMNGLEPADVLRYFAEISRIPRESGNEEGVRKYLKEFADERGLTWVEDSTGNIIVRKPASPGYESAPSTALQGHMDMVCVKEEGYEHDFAVDPILLKVEGDELTAEGTTLGADNGIALAMVLAIFDDPKALHGPLEGIFTVSEETGLDGAFGLEIDNIESRRLINLDSEEEGFFYIGCAGGGEVVAELPAEYTRVPDTSAAFEIAVTGLLGGHSGSEIHTGRGNAIKIVFRYLRKLTRESPVRIVSLAGGTKRNVIPSSCRCTFAIEKGAAETAVRLAEELQSALTRELGTADPNAAVKLTEADLPKEAVSAQQSKSVIDAVYITPHGVEAMSRTIEGLVETSNNVAVARLSEGSFRITASQRSSILSARDEIEERTCAALETCGAVTRRENKYPAWTPNPDSRLAQLCSRSYERFTGKTPEISAIHGGLECGVINSKAPDMDSISFGPNLSGVHSPDERMSISSAARVYDFVKKLLVDIAEEA